MDIKDKIMVQREFFMSGKTLDIDYRIELLKSLRSGIIEMEEEISSALKKDLGKSSFESYMCEIGLVLSEINYMIKHIRKFSKKERVKTPLSQFKSKSYKVKSPYGLVLIMSPWNYPFMLTISPLVDAISAGNVAVVKPSAYSKYTSEIIKKLLEKYLPVEVVTVALGGRDVNSYLLDLKYDYIFFTGSVSVGKLVMEKASKNLTPVTLELGGKSPCIVDSSTDLKLAAKRIVFGKYLNLGQTCVAPDYVLVKEDMKEEFIKYLKEEILIQFGKDPIGNKDYGKKDYGKIINEKHFIRLRGLIENEDVIIGGFCDEDRLKIEPTVIDNVTMDSSSMKEEIFGPILPVMTFNNREDIIDIIKINPTPLALYIFTDDDDLKNYILNNVSFGGGCVNDTIIHLATEQMGFGGVGTSGMGSYHGKTGFDTFTHEKSIVEKSNFIDLPMRYQPYTKRHEKLLRKFLK
ncbi:aldehyde dehydrogenase [Anaerofustis stercorihominis]|uniref:aldehyde dehydrogenase n=1 Tax=Anaerofustis stercorihominis TaxID=214853 RepID=UPI0039913E1A